MISKLDIERIRKWQGDPFEFVFDVWGLTPQPLKPQYLEIVDDIPCEDFEVEMFEPFVKGKHLTWHQFVLILAVKRSLRDGKKKIAVESGVGTGKSSVIAILLLWFLWCFENAQVPCTAPTREQMEDILWKEVALWLERMPAFMRAKYEWTTGYIRISEKPETWFARARTGKKENPEALSGVHADNVLLLVDEASGIPNEIYTKAEGVMSGENVIVILISQHTRLIGYFHDCFGKNRDAWLCLSFDARQSPIVNQELEESIRKQYGEDSYEYRTQIIGTSPKADAVDDKGYVPLLAEADLHFGPEVPFVANSRLGIDPAGEGDDESVWVHRDRFKAKILLREKISTPKGIAQKTVTFLKDREINANKTWVDNFGEGANVGMEVARTGQFINPVNVKIDADDKDRFLNKRAEAFWRMRQWLKSGGELIGDGWGDLLTIRYRATLGKGGKIQIMPKEEMKKIGIKSPNVADALMLTFVEDDDVYIESVVSAADDEDFNPHAAI